MTRGALLLALLALSLRGARAATLVVVNRLPQAINVLEPRKSLLEAGKVFTVRGLGDETSFSGKQVKLDSGFAAALPQGTQRYAILLVNSADRGGAQMHDTNDLQVALSSAAHACSDAGGEAGVTAACLAQHTFGGGLDGDFVRQAFQTLWNGGYKYWHLCNELPPAAAVAQRRSGACNEHGCGMDVQVLQQTPLVAAVRGFVGPRACGELMREHAGLDTLVRAHVGGGESGTSTSESRETLTTNMFVNWDLDNVLSRTAAAAFDLSSEMLGARVPYEAQEPVNFLHYLKGFEYKPHMDGGGGGVGKRVATTLIYCEAASEGGGTVFPQTELRFQPAPGDLLFFEYAGENPYLQEHAACPVIAGNKSTLTQWHRLGVTPEKPWDQYESWGRFYNPHEDSRWKGPRYGKDPTTADEL